MRRRLIIGVSDYGFEYCIRLDPEDYSNSKESVGSFELVLSNTGLHRVVPLQGENNKPYSFIIPLLSDEVVVTNKWVLVLAETLPPRKVVSREVAIIVATTIDEFRYCQIVQENIEDLAI